MDTYVTIQIPGGLEQIQIIEKAFDRIEAIDHKFNILEQNNALYAFNNSHSPVQDKEILDLIQTAIKIGSQTDGAFDITIYPLMKHWGFFDKSPSLPENKDIHRLLMHVGLDKLLLTDNQLSKSDTLTQIDLGGIAKGYAIKGALEVIKEAGIQSALIDAGGDIYALGELYGKPWKVGIRNPRGEGIIGSFNISDLAVVTSGDYERFFEKDGVKYHHILDPKTGYPARGLASVSIIADNPVIADVLSTAIFVMGKDKGLAFLEKTKLAEALIVTEDNQRFSTSGLQ
ncbi:FAD:protein FMN transferase [candidate division KSB1 bacterium]|nr:FAD:protein FMN transferase [candidate division KSB1 bacterium]